ARRVGSAKAAKVKFSVSVKLLTIRLNNNRVKKFVNWEGENPPNPTLPKWDWGDFGSYSGNQTN
ncbi:MAG: hypothetical protein NZ810_11120, partial [Dehalococcoidia bacterium]|nr:hypothetical protein [Dehalococcoidia bacterium]